MKFSAIVHIVILTGLLGLTGAGCNYSKSPFQVVEPGTGASSEGKMADISNDDDVIVAPEAKETRDEMVDADADADAETAPSPASPEAPSARHAEVIPPTVTETDAARDAAMAPSDPVLPVVGGRTVTLNPGVIPPSIPGRSVSFNPGIVVDPTLSDRVALVTRSEEGRLSLCLKSADTAKWADGLACIYVPTMGKVFGQPAVVYSTGSLHIMARNEANKISYTVCPAADPSYESCRARNIEGSIKDDVSLVALKDGTLQGFVRTNDEDRLWTFRFHGDLEGFSSERICASPMWNSPTAVVSQDEEGKEQVTVFYRDNDWFNGHLVTGKLSEGKPWECRMSLDMGEYSLGSVPAAYYNGWTKTFDVLGKEHRPTRLDGFLARWSVSTAGAFFSPLEKGGKIVDDEADFPYQHRLGVAVYGNGRSDGSIHVVYRAGRLGVLRYAVNNDPAHKSSFQSFWLNEEMGTIPTRPGLAFSAPAIAVDGVGKIHVFARPSRSDLGTLRHYFTSISSDSWLNSGITEAVFWQSEGLNVPMATDASPVAVTIPSR